VTPATSPGWLPDGRSAAVCLSVDDVHPARSTDGYEAGGDLLDGVLGRLEWLLERHPQLRPTLFVTPNWRESSAVPTRRTWARVPVLREHIHLAPRQGRCTMRLDRHPGFCRHLREHPRYEIGVHGLTHCAPGRRPPLEFDRLGAARTRRRLRRARALFRDAEVATADGFAPPGWSLTAALARGLVDAGFTWVAAARDLITPIARGAVTAMSGPNGLSLLDPQPIAGGRLMHIPVNFQATSADDRALEVLRCGGLLSIKAHATGSAMGHVALDAFDRSYAKRLDRLFMRLEDELGDELWWTTMGRVAARARDVRA
jgi:peptidoglycan/xylan/chitin deacetylase (PgdA/CDA1 family)